MLAVGADQPVLLMPALCEGIARRHGVSPTWAASKCAEARSRKLFA